MAGHARFSASARSRWRACSGSLALIERIEQKQPDLRKGSSIHADRGTSLHWLLNKALTEGLELRVGFIVPEPKPYTVTKEDVDGIQLALDYIRGILEVAEMALYEQPLPLDWVHSQTGGTGDVLILEKDGTLNTIDLKTGYGTFVDAFDNHQMQLYSLGGWTLFPQATRFRNTIIQPFNPVGEPIRHDRVYTVADMLDLVNEIRAEIARAEAEEAELTVGQHCRYCPAILQCPAQVLNLTKMMPRAGFNPTPENLANVLKAAAYAKKFVETCQDAAHTLALKGVPIPGHKLVSKRASYDWNPQVDMEVKLKELNVNPYTEPKLITPAEAKKRAKAGGMKATVLDQFIINAASGTNLVLEEEPKAPIPPVDVASLPKIGE